MTKKILITGADGFVGTNLTMALGPRYDVAACNRKQLDLLDTQRVASFLESEKFDVVIHTAVYDAAPEFSTNDPNKVLEYNLRMFDNIARCDYSYKTMIYFGSGAAARRETSYGLSKYLMDQVTQNKNNIYNLRLYSVYGKGTDWRYRFINNACAKVSLGLPIKIPCNGKNDYLCVDDLCRIVEYYMHNFKDLPKSRDICSGDVLSAEEIVNYIRLVRSDVEVLQWNEVSTRWTGSRAKSSIADYFGDPSHVGALPINLTSIERGIEQLISFYENSSLDPKEFIY